MRIVRLVLYIAILMTTASYVLFAQETPIPAGVRATINEITYAANGVRCGKYFFSHPSLTKFGKTSISFNFITPPLKDGVTTIDILSKMDLEKFRIVEDPTLKAPTFMIIKDRKGGPEFEIAISPEDLRKSPCLRIGISA